MGIVGVDDHGLALGVGVDDVAGKRLDLLDGHGAGDAQDLDLTVGVRGVETIARYLPAVHVDVGAVRVGDLKLDPGQRLLGLCIQLVDDEAARLLVPEGQVLTLPDFDGDGLGR